MLMRALDHYLMCWYCLECISSQHAVMYLLLGHDICPCAFSLAPRMANGVWIVTGANNPLSWQLLLWLCGWGATGATGTVLLCYR